jgi:large subunit ribosomal protein L10
MVTRLRDKFSRARGLVLTDYKGMTVAEITELRESLKKSGIEYRVVKNTLAGIATEGTQAEVVREKFVGPVGVALAYDDAAGVTRGVLEYAKKNDKFKVTWGVLEGIVCDEGQIRRIANLPPKEVLLSVLAGTMNAPAAKLVRLMAATVARLGYALHALKEKKAAS